MRAIIYPHKVRSAREAMAKRKRDDWKKQMATCSHPVVEIVDIDGREYGICKECFWFMPGNVAHDLQAA